MTQSKGMQRMIKARAGLIMDQRFFGSLALRLQLVEDPNAESMWIDGVSLGFNPEWILSLTMDELKGVICHEIEHVIFGHHLRRGNREAEDWNEACDYAIDPLILQAGMKLPGGGHIDPSFKDQAAGKIYSTIQGRKPKKEEGGDGGAGQGSGNQQQQNQQQNGQNDPSKQQPQQGQGQGKGNKPQQAKTGGSGCGEVRDYPGADGQGATESEKQQHQQEWQIATASAARIAEGCGQMPGSLKELVKEMLDPKVPWREVLQRFVDQITHNDYTYTRTNPRYAAFGVIMPSLYNKDLPPIDIWIDTSGSIDSEDKKQFVGEINDIRSHYHTTIRIIYCDTAVRHVETIEPNDLFTQLDCRGGGGTRFSPAIAWSNEQEEQPCCGIYLTDMGCSNFGEEPDFPVLWIQTKGRKEEPPFGEYIHMNPKRY